MNSETVFQTNDNAFDLTVKFIYFCTDWWNDEANLNNKNMQNLGILLKMIARSASNTAAELIYLFVNNFCVCYYCGLLLAAKTATCLSEMTNCMLNALFGV